MQYSWRLLFVISGRERSERTPNPERDDKLSFMARDSGFGPTGRPGMTSRRVEPAEADRITLAAEQAHGLVQRQADHVRVGSDDLHDEASGDALRRVTAGLAAPFAGGEIGLDV